MLDTIIALLRSFHYGRFINVLYYYYYLFIYLFSKFIWHAIGLQSIF